MKSITKILFSVTVIIIVTAIALTAFVFVPNSRFKANRETVDVKVKDEIDLSSNDKIHFLNTENSDAILLESNGMFALIDAGEDNDNPRGFEGLELKGFEDRVLEYLKENASDENGVVHLDFVLGTHCHSDHIGGFDTVISDDSVEVGRAYLKEYDASKISKNEVEEWDNQEVYDQMVNALTEKNVPIISKMNGEPFTLGDFTITLFNTEDPKNDKKVGENDRSLGVLVEKNGARVFLSGDIDNITGDEDRLAPEIGEVDILKVGHHSYQRSTSSNWLKTLKPKACVVTNRYESLHMATIRRITKINSCPILVTGKENGVIAQIDDNGEMSFYNNIH